MVRPEGTESFKFNHTMLRVKDPKVSLKFYQDVVGRSLLRLKRRRGLAETDDSNIDCTTGMELIDQHEASDFTLYFLAFPLPE